MKSLFLILVVGRLARGGEVSVGDVDELELLVPVVLVGSLLLPPGHVGGEGGLKERLEPLVRWPR